MWDLPGPGLEPVSPALAGGFLTTAPPGKPWFFSLFKRLRLYHCHGCILSTSHIPPHKVNFKIYHILVVVIRKKREMYLFNENNSNFSQIFIQNHKITYWKYFFKQEGYRENMSLITLRNTLSDAVWINEFIFQVLNYILWRWFPSPHICRITENLRA